MNNPKFHYLTALVLKEGEKNHNDYFKDMKTIEPSFILEYATYLAEKNPVYILIFLIRTIIKNIFFIKIRVLVIAIIF